MEKNNKIITAAWWQKKKQYWNLKYQIPDPTFSYIYELNITNINKG